MIRRLRRNLGLKLVSLALAYVAWAYVTGRSPGVRFIVAPVEFLAPEGLAVVDHAPRDVRVRLEGDARAISRLAEQNIYLRVQLDPNLRPGRHQRVAVRERDIVGTPAGMAKDIDPPTVMVTLERLVSRTVPVAVRLAGSPAEGHRVSRQVAEPDAVEISGPEDVVRTVENVFTDDIDLSGRQRSFTARVDLARPDARTVVRPASVQVQVAIEEAPRVIELRAPVQLEQGAGLVADPAEVRVVLEGPPSLLRQVDEGLAAVPLTDDLAARGGAPVRLVFGRLTTDQLARIRIVSIDPPRVRLKRGG